MNQYNAEFLGSYYQPAPHEITREELRARAATHEPTTQKVIEDFSNSSERLEQIGAMTPTESGLQYWVQDSVTMESIIVAECVWLLHLVPEYRSRVPRGVRLAFEALTTPELKNRACLHSLSNYLKYIDDFPVNHPLHAHGQVLGIIGSSTQPSRLAPVTLQQPTSQPIPTILVTRASPVAVPRGLRTSGTRTGGVTGTHQYEWPESRKLAWLIITPRLARFPSRALSDSYCRFNSVAIWEHVDVRMLGPNIEVNLVEIVAFFPRAASSWRALWKRFEVGGWTLPMLRILIFYQRQLGTAELRAHTFGSMKKHRRDAQKHQCHAAGFVLNSINTDRVGSNNEFNDLRDCFLFSLGDGLVHFPQGADEGMLTIAVRHSRLHGHDNVRLSQIEQYITQEGLDTQYHHPGPSLVPVVQADQASHERLFPDETYDISRAHDPNYDHIKKWWRAGGYFHDV